MAPGQTTTKTRATEFISQIISSPHRTLLFPWHWVSENSLNVPIIGTLPSPQQTVEDATSGEEEISSIVISRFNDVDLNNEDLCFYTEDYVNDENITSPLTPLTRMQAVHIVSFFIANGVEPDVSG